MDNPFAGLTCDSMTFAAADHVDVCDLFETELDYNLRNLLSSPPRFGATSTFTIDDRNTTTTGAPGGIRRSHYRLDYPRRSEACSPIRHGVVRPRRMASTDMIDLYVGTDHDADGGTTPQRHGLGSQPFAGLISGRTATSARSISARTTRPVTRMGPSMRTVRRTTTVELPKLAPMMTVRPVAMQSSPQRWTSCSLLVRTSGARRCGPCPSVARGMPRARLPGEIPADRTGAAAPLTTGTIATLPSAR